MISSRLHGSRSVLDTPVLFLVFNRPQLTSIVFEAIRRARPTKLFIAADGPRAGNADDAALCGQVRSIVQSPDWNCEVHFLYRETNLGCGLAVSSAIDWFFDHVDRGIILEDDCLPDPSFFNFCSQLLEYYTDDPSVMSISGTNLLPAGWKTKKQSYHFAHGGVWGWATWKRAWQKYDYSISEWGEPNIRQRIKRAIQNDNWFGYFSSLFTDTWSKEIDTWDVQWFFNILNNGGLAINPAVNLVRNIGFGSHSTHTGDQDSPYARLQLNKMTFPIIHPPQKSIDRTYLSATFRYVTRGGSAGLLKRLKAGILKMARGISNRYRHDGHE